MSKPGWQLTRGQRATYSVGMFSSSMVTATVLAWTLYFYAPPPNQVDSGMVFLGVAIAVGVARLIGSLVDALTNPLVAFWSDRSTNPKGRRKPFILRGAIPLALFAILVWFPPVRGTSIWNVVWLATTLSGTWFFFTYVVAPYLALMPELTTHPEERVSLTVTMAYWEALAIIIANLAVPPLIEAFKGGVQLGPIFIADGFKLTAIVLAVVGAVGFFISMSRVKEKPLAAERLSKFSLVKSVTECFRNPAFPPYLIAVFAAKIGMGLVLISMPFLATAVLLKGEGFLAVLMAPLFLSTMLGFGLAQVLVNRVGLKRAFRIATFVAFLAVLGFFGAYFIGDEGKPLTDVRDLDSGDIVLMFSDQAASIQADDATLASAERFESTDQGIRIRLTAVEWYGLFHEPDINAFREAVDAMDPATAAAMLRADTADEREVGALGAKAWLTDQDVETLSHHLLPEHAAQLFPKPKRRYDEDARLLVQAPRFESKPTADGAVRLSLEVAKFRPPEETFNLDGWGMVFTDEAEREAMAPPMAATVEGGARILLEGDLRFRDGSVVVSGFRADPEQTVGTEVARNLLADEEKLAYLASTLEARIEFGWSARIWVIFFFCFLLGFPAAVLMSMYRPIVCEIVDLDEERVGTRREGMYFGVEGLLTKAADGVSGLLAPAVMALGFLLAPPPFGYVLSFAVGAAFMLLGYFIFGRYPLGAPTCATSTPTAAEGSAAEIPAEPSPDGEHSERS